MAASQKIVVFMVSLVTLISAVRSDNGTATYYTQSGPPPACFISTLPTTLYAAASPAIWSPNNACGRRYRITCTAGTNPSLPNPCTGATVEVQIIDYCPDCQATFDLSQNAFAIIADINAGTILIEYDQL